MTTDQIEAVLRKRNWLEIPVYDPGPGMLMKHWRARHDPGETVNVLRSRAHRAAHRLDKAVFTEVIRCQDRRHRCHGRWVLRIES